METRYSVSPYLIVEELRSDSDFKRKVLEELESTRGKDAPVMPLLREYIASLSAIMDEVRQLYKDRREAWSKTLDEWMHRYAEAASETGEEMVGLAALKTDDNGKIVLEIHLSVQFKERIAALHQTNRHLVNLHRLQVAI